jgi:hypothetical protein
MEKIVDKRNLEHEEEASVSDSDISILSVKHLSREYRGSNMSLGNTKGAE